MKKDKLIPIVVGATALGVVGSMVGAKVFRGGGSPLQPEGSHVAVWWAQGAEPALWRNGARTASALAERQISALGSEPSLGAIADANAAWFDVVGDSTLALMKRERAGDKNAALVGPAIEAVEAHRSYAWSMRIQSIVMSTARATTGQVTEFRERVRRMARTLDAGHYAIGAPKSGGSDGSWLDTAVTVALYTNPVYWTMRSSAFIMETGAGIAGGMLSRAAGDAAGAAVGAVGNLAGGLLKSPLGAIVIGGGVLWYLRGGRK